MTKAIVALIMSVLELIAVWTSFPILGDIDQRWIETLLMVATPGLVWLFPSDWLTRAPWPGRGA